MRSSSVLWLTTSILLSCAAPQTPPVASEAAPAASEDERKREATAQEALRLNDEAAELIGQGKYSEAIPVARRSLELTESVRGKVHRDVSADLITLAGLYRHEGDFLNAEPMILRAIDIDKTLFGPQDPEVGVDLCALGTLYARKGQPELATKKHDEGLTLLAADKGGGHIEATGVCFMDLGEALFSLNKYAPALEAMNNAEQIFEVVEPSRAASILTTIAEEARAHGNQKLAAAALERAKVLRGAERRAQP